MFADYVFTVHAVDCDGNKEANVSEVLALLFSDGAPVAQPAEPRLVDVQAVAAGSLKIEWLYDPVFEVNGPGAAYETRIYWDAGTGALDFSEPHVTVEMGHQTAAARYAWRSAALTDGQEYRFVVRIATAAWPDGLETQGTDDQPATVDTHEPSLPAMGPA